jgi:ribosomal protein L11 methyltransferase
MTWLEVSIRVNEATAAAAEAAMERLGALAVTLEDAADDPVLEPSPGSTPLWPTVQVRGLFEPDAGRKRIVEVLQTVAGSQRPGLIEWREIGERDWARAWMDRFRPMRFGRRLWVVPAGMQIPAAADNVEVRLDPGLAFGTGTHPTTALCLEWLDGHGVQNCRVVDYGCGSGILGIAAARLGAAAVVCVDNDPQALEATAVNAARNGVADRLVCRAPERFAESESDVVLANILAGPLVELAPLLTGCLKPGGHLVLSGLLEEQAEDVVAAYRPSCAQIGSAERDGWARLDLKKSK